MCYCIGKLGGCLTGLHILSVSYTREHHYLFTSGLLFPGSGESSLVGSLGFCAGVSKILVNGSQV